MRYFYIPEVIIQSGVAKTPIETSGETVGGLLMLMMKRAIDHLVRQEHSQNAPEKEDQPGDIFY